MSHLEAQTLSQGYKRYCNSPRVKANPPSFEDYRNRFGKRFETADSEENGNSTAPTVVEINGQMFTLVSLPDGIAEGARTSLGSVKQSKDAYAPRNPNATASGKRLWLLNAAGVAIPQGCTDGMAHALISEHGYDNLKSRAS